MSTLILRYFNVQCQNIFILCRKYVQVDIVSGLCLHFTIAAELNWNKKRTIGQVKYHYDSL